MSKYTALILILLLACSSSFLSINTVKSRLTIFKMSSLTDVSSVVDSLLQTVPKDLATKEFWFFFFGGSGALGIGAAQIPKLLKEFDEVRQLAGGKSLGGPVLPCNPLATFSLPEPLREKDILQLIQKPPSITKISESGEKKSYMAKLGYLERNGYLKALGKDYNPVAAYAVFECLSEGGGSLAAPQIALEKFQSWKEPNGIEKFKTDLLTATFKKYSAYIVFVFLIALTLDLIVESGIDAFL